MFGLAAGFYHSYLAPTKLSILFVGIDGAGKTALLERCKVTQFRSQHRDGVGGVGGRGGGNGTASDPPGVGVGSGRLRRRHSEGGNATATTPAASASHRTTPASPGVDIVWLDGRGPSLSSSSASISGAPSSQSPVAAGPGRPQAAAAAPAPLLRHASSDPNPVSSGASSPRFLDSLGSGGAHQKQQQQQQQQQRRKARAFQLIRCPAPRAYSRESMASADRDEYVEEEGEEKYEAGMALATPAATTTTAAAAAAAAAARPTTPQSSRIGEHEDISSSPFSGNGGEGVRTMTNSQSSVTRRRPTNGGGRAALIGDGGGGGDDEWRRGAARLQSEAKAVTGDGGGTGGGGTGCTGSGCGVVVEHDLKKGAKMLPMKAIRPTLGQNLGKIEACGCKLEILDLGGSPKMRPLWDRYLGDVDAVVYVVDASPLSSRAKLEESAEAFRGVMEKLRQSGNEGEDDAMAASEADVPVMVFANKMDVEYEEALLGERSRKATDEDGDPAQVDGGDGEDGPLRIGLDELSVLFRAEYGDMKKGWTHSSVASSPRVADNTIDGLLFFEGSAKTGEGVRAAFEWLIPAAKVAQRERQKIS